MHCRLFDKSAMMMMMMMMMMMITQSVISLSVTGFGASPNKILEGFSRDSLHRVRRSASASSYLPLRFFDDSNEPASASYPRFGADVQLDETSMYRYAGVPDSPQVARLRGDLDNMNPNEGRVELKYRSNWGLACDDYFGQEEANVYCRNLGFKKGANKPLINSYFGTGKYRRWNILIGNIKCRDFKSQQNLFDCNYNLMPSCSLRSTAGVQCKYNEGCEHGWTAYDGICYKVIKNKITPQLAAAQCADAGAKLAFINSIREADFITNMMYTKFKDISALWTGGRYAAFADVKAKEAWAFRDTIHQSNASSPLWFPGFGSGSDSRPTGNPKQRSCIALSKIFYNSAKLKDVDVNYFWWDNISCKNRLPFLCQKLGTITNDCYANNGRDYRGEAQRTNKGTPCQRWSDSQLVNARTHPNKGLGEHSYCRNPDGDVQPWCWVDTAKNIFGYCSLRRCDSGQGEAEVGQLGEASFNNSRCDAPHQFYCPSMINYRPICIEKPSVCNGHQDCVGGEDEAMEFCKRYKCSSDQFYCRKSHKCIPKSRVCDNYFDCDYGDDEAEALCKNYKPSVNNATTLDHYQNIDGVTESAIPSQAQQTVYYHVTLQNCKTKCDNSLKFVCKSFIHYATYALYDASKCILLNQKLTEQQLQAAGDGTASYYARNISCTESNTFLCNNSRCIERSKMCNGYDDCGDFSDEIGPASCPSAEPTFTVRLNGGRAPNEGRIEVKLFNEWGLVCDDGLDANMAAVVCKQLGFDGYERFSKNSRKEFGRGSGQFLLSGVACTGSEGSLYNCPHAGWHQAGNCSIGNVPGLVCLKPRPCTDKEFKCSDRCIPLAEVCDGVQQCSSGEDEERCDKADWTLQLVNGKNSSSGIVEIVRGGVAGAVCDDAFDRAAASAVCKQLGIAGRAEVVKGGTVFQPPSGLVMWLQSVRCSGQESSLFDCQLNNWGRTVCDLNEAVGVFCGLADVETTSTSSTVATTVAGYDGESECGNRIGNFPAGRIINGYPASVGQFPWQVGIRLKISADRTQQWCGGTVINDRWIVTAAHCFNYPKSYYQLRIGDLDNTKMEQYERHFDIDLLILHPQYAGKPTFDYDLTLIRIKPDSKGYLQFNAGIQPACLPKADLQVPTGTMCHVSGWGSVGDYQIPENLMAANVPLITRDRCNQLYYNRITERMQCAGFEAGGIDSCQGDSGGPLVCHVNGKYTLIGATSWGEGCAVPGSPGVYANVRNMRAWIDETISSNA